eukprot:gene21590-8300_t
MAATARDDELRNSECSTQNESTGRKKIFRKTGKQRTQEDVER